LRDAWSEFDGRAEIFGVSIDSTASHEKFIAKYDLPFPCSRIARKIVNAYGVWVEKA
jgi:peroxiredoxin Q/BCP